MKKWTIDIFFLHQLTGLIETFQVKYLVWVSLKAVLQTEDNIADNSDVAEYIALYYNYSFKNLRNTTLDIVSIQRLYIIYDLRYSSQWL